MNTDTTRSLQRVLIARTGQVHLAAPTTDGPVHRPGIDLLEAEVVDRGYALSFALRTALGHLDDADLAAAGSTLLSDLDALVGSGRTHQPMFRLFPDGVPDDTAGLLQIRFLVHYLQEPGQRCVMCASTTDVAPVNPCAHVVCSSCFPSAAHAACPICYRALDRSNPYFTAGTAADVVRHAKATVRPNAPARLRVLALTDDLDRAVDTELAALLGRSAALSGTDREHLQVLLDTRDRADLTWLPEQVPGRETKALVGAWLTATSEAAAVEAACALMDTATDVARLLVVRSGGDASMVDPPRLAAVPRPLRRALLGVLERLCGAGKAHLVADDMARRPAMFKRIGEKLHPFEHAGTYPAAAAMFAVIRRTRLTGDTLTTRLLDAAGPLYVAADHLYHRSLTSQVEALLRANDPVSAAGRLVTERPGELVRRLDHLLRLAGAVDASATFDHDEDDDAVNGSATRAILDLLARAVPHVAPTVLASTLGALRTRPVKDTADDHPRVFFTAAGRTHIAQETRRVLPAGVAADAAQIITGELLSRAEELPAVGVALIDRSLDTVIAPFAERTAARALSTLARGTKVALPDGHRVRLFTHWMESDERVDLDLSVAMFNASWAHIDTCDYTRQRSRLGGATHSGDYTSAPAPDGASEFLDLDLDALATAQVAYVVATVLSYNDVAFDDMAEAFAGLMALPDGYDGSAFDARGVEQRFDLAGRHKAHLMLVIDVADRSWRWADLAVSVTGTDHAIWNAGGSLGIVAAALTDVFDRNARISLGEVATWHAAARAATVLVRDLDQNVRSYTRGTAETVDQFAARLRDVDAGQPVPAAQVPPAALVFVTTGDIDSAPGAHAFALHPRDLDSSIHLLAGPDVLGSLTSA